MNSERGWNKVFPSNRVPEIILAGFVALFFVICFIIAGRRYFNFDEFQVLYASTSILRGKAYFADRIDAHFPLCHILMGFLISLTGFKTSALLASRYLIFFANAITCLYVYRIASRLWNRNAGLLAVAILLSTVAFVDKGLEIRHDVFNTLFNVMAAYYGIRYLTDKKRLHLVVCGLLLGMAVASTQKAVVWSCGIVLGLTISQLREGGLREAGKMLLAFALLIPTPLVVSLIGLITVSHESLSVFIRYAVLDRVSFLNPYLKEIFPFPHDRYDLLKELVKANPLFYFIGVCGLVFFAVKMRRSPGGTIILVLWCVLGILFYLTVRRPFFQSFLPTIPPLAIVASGFLIELRDVLLKRSLVVIQLALSLVCFIFLFLWPLQFIIPKAGHDGSLSRQLYNVDFCLANLKNTEKVLCFTQNQVFFDPMFPLMDRDRGERFFDMDPFFFERKMMQDQCRVIINDYRTRLLNRGIQEKIKANYLPLKNGHILIPGFKLEPDEFVGKEIWVEGHYFTPTLSLEVDGRKIEEELVQLTQGPHTFVNRTDRPVFLVHIFKPEQWVKR